MLVQLIGCQNWRVCERKAVNRRTFAAWIMAAAAFVR